MALAWLPQYFVCLVIRRYRIMRWSGDQSQLGRQCNVSYFFLFEGTDLLVVLSHVNILAVLCS